MKAFPSNYQKKRIIICTDIGGGDRDDMQSMIHYLCYSNMFDLEGIVVGRPKGRIEAMKPILQAYKKDYPKLVANSTYEFQFPTPQYIRSVTVSGAESGGHAPARGWDKPTEGSKLIVQAARRSDSRPLNVICWGSATDLAQAVHDAPGIESKIKAFVVGGTGYNYDGDPSPTEYLKRSKRLNWVLADTTVRGIYMPGLNDKKKYGNVGFVEQVIKPSGALGKLFYEISEPINVNRYGIKMGDTGSLLFLFNGDFSAPDKDSWAGSYVHKEFYRWGDTLGLALGPYPGAALLAKHRKDILKDWENRLLWLRK